MNSSANVPTDAPIMNTTSQIMDSSMPAAAAAAVAPPVHRPRRSKTIFNPLVTSMLMSTNCNEVEATMTQCMQQQQHYRSNSDASFVCQAAEKFLSKCAASS